jgi:hypothetical protein
MNDVMYRNAQDLAATRIAEARQYRQVAAVRKSSKRRYIKALS